MSASDPSPEPDPGVRRAAELFKALAAPARVSILRALRQPSTVSQLVERTGLSQPLVSQHLRVLRGVGVVSYLRSGREAIYRVTDDHVTHVIEDAITHGMESTTEGP